MVWICIEPRQKERSMAFLLFAALGTCYCTALWDDESLYFIKIHSPCIFEFAGCRPMDKDIEAVIMKKSLRTVRNSNYEFRKINSD